MVYEHDYYNHIERSIARYLVFIQNCYPAMPQIHKIGRLPLITNSNLLSQLLIVCQAEREENLEPPSPPSQVTPLTKKAAGFPKSHSSNQMYLRKYIQCHAMQSILFAYD